MQHRAPLLGDLTHSDKAQNAEPSSSSSSSAWGPVKPKPQRLPGPAYSLGPKEKHMVRVCLYYVVPFMLLGLLTGVLYLNLRHGSNCHHGESAPEASLNRMALETRIMALEEQLMENSLLLETFIKKLDTRFKVIDAESVSTFREAAHVEARKIALHLVEEPPPPMPFYIAEALESDDLDTHFEAAYNGVKASSTKDDTNVVTYSTSTSKDVRGSSSSSGSRSTIVTGGSSSSSSSGSRISLGAARSVGASSSLASSSSSGRGVGVFASEESKKAAKADKEALEVCRGISDKFPKLIPAELLPMWKEYDCDHKLAGVSSQRGLVSSTLK